MKKFEKRYTAWSKARRQSGMGPHKIDDRAVKLINFVTKRQAAVLQQDA